MPSLKVDLKCTNIVMDEILRYMEEVKDIYKNLREDPNT